MKYKESQKILYEQGNAKSLEGNSHMSDDIESRKSEDKKMPKDARLCLVASCDRAGTNSTTQSTINNSDLSDSRDVTSEQLRAEVDENADLSDFQKEQLYALLSKYRNHLTKRPRRCNLFEYKFEMKGDKLKSRNAWPISFALRAQVKEQIQEMLKDNILEESFSDYVNLLTIVERPGKSIRICIDARRVNTHMMPDRVKVDPMKKLLQRFHGSKFITTIDLSSAFLQVPLHRSSRKWTSFQFGNQVYQYKVVPYGFKNSLLAFIRALDKALEDGLADNVVTYMRSGCFEDHLRHPNTVLEKLMTAANNVLVDILSRYPSELNVVETRELSRPGTIMVHAIDLKVDNRVCKDLKNLGKLQNTDPRLKGLKDKVTEDTSPLGAKFRLKDDVLFCWRDSTNT